MKYIKGTDNVQYEGDNIIKSDELDVTKTAENELNGHMPTSVSDFNLHAKIENGQAEPAVEEEGRVQWNNKAEFILTMIGYAVGLGNVWRFPYLCQKNGGGAFLFPYLIALVVLGIPLFYMELAIGQRIREGPVKVWQKIAPALAGVGMSASAVSFLLGLYYNMIVAWCLYYLFISFQGTMPYSVCPTSMQNVTEYRNVTGVMKPFSIMKEMNVPECQAAGPTQYYWYRVVLETTDSIDESGGLNWKMVGCLALAWAIVFGITCKGVSSIGKVVYVTALFPYLVLTAFFINGMMLKGAEAGIKRFFIPKFEELAKPIVWVEACTQIFYNLNIAFGGIIAMSSYNPINNNIVRDACLVSVINGMTSVFAGVVIFSVIGFKATLRHDKCIEAAGLNNVAADACESIESLLDKGEQGPGLAFVAFTEAITNMPFPPIWSVLFFCMLLTLGIGSMIGTLECVRTTIVDMKLLKVRQEVTGLIICVVAFLMGLIFCQRSGEYWLQMFDEFTGGTSLLVIALFEVIGVMYVYGFAKFKEDVIFMLGDHKWVMNFFWKTMLTVAAPLILTFLLGYSIYDLFSTEITYKPWNSVTATNTTPTPFPAWGEAFCFLLIALVIMYIPGVPLLKKLRSSMRR